AAALRGAEPVGLRRAELDQRGDEHDVGVELGEEAVGPGRGRHAALDRLDGAAGGGDAGRAEAAGGTAEAEPARRHLPLRARPQLRRLAVARLEVAEVVGRVPELGRERRPLRPPAGGQLPVRDPRQLRRQRLEPAVGLARLHPLEGEVHLVAALGEQAQRRPERGETGVADDEQQPHGTAAGSRSAASDRASSSASASEAAACSGPNGPSASRRASAMSASSSGPCPHTTAGSPARTAAYAPAPYGPAKPEAGSPGASSGAKSS